METEDTCSPPLGSSTLGVGLKQIQTESKVCSFCPLLPYLTKQNKTQKETYKRQEITVELNLYQYFYQSGGSAATAKV